MNYQELLLSRRVAWAKYYDAVSFPEEKRFQTDFEDAILASLPDSLKPFTTIFVKIIAPKDKRASAVAPSEVSFQVMAEFDTQKPLKKKTLKRDTFEWTSVEFSPSKSLKAQGLKLSKLDYNQRVMYTVGMAKYFVEKYEKKIPAALMSIAKNKK